MKSYIELKVPIDYEASWFSRLRSMMKDIPVVWQKGYYHITMAFIDETPKGVDLCPSLEKQLRNAIAPTLTFDKLDVFSIWSGMHIINLTVTNIPASFLSLTDSIRSDMKAAGCIIESDFLLHVTLGRVNVPSIKLSELQGMMSSVLLSPFQLTLTDVNYIEFRGRTLYMKKLQTNAYETYT